MDMSVASAGGELAVLALNSSETEKTLAGSADSRWRLVEDLFETAVKKTPTERSRYLNQVCKGNEDLRREVESLLRHDELTKGIFQSAVCKALQELPTRRDKHIGSRIGPYHVVRQLSQGGMGIVYLAIRSDQHYLQTVAIKIVKSGVNSEELVSRFRYERQILANLTHPNIGAILDGGSTKDGLPYIVMEYIDGRSITEFSRSRALSIRERIALFRSVCLAVHYAHQKLVIHRDIKPSNILVTQDGVPKLLDFGIAKLLAPELIPGDAPPTMPANRLMTPDYASPEQVLGKPVTTSADIYSLGVVLFELLTESRPYKTTSLPPSELERLVCHETTSKPSATAGLPRRIAKELRGDLDNIVLMAMRKEPDRRYNSVEQFAEDLSRYLDGKPVIARQDTPLYRGEKFLKRHKTMAAAISGLFFVLAAGTTTTVSQAHTAERHRTELRTFVDSVILKLNDEIGGIPQSTEFREALASNTVDYLDNLAKDPDIDPKLSVEMARVYAKVGQIQGYPFNANLGHEDQALASFEKALRIAARLARQSASDSAATQLLIEMHLQVGAMQAYMGDIAKAVESNEKALRLAKAFAERPGSVLPLPIDDVPNSQRAGESRRSLLAAAHVGLAYAEAGAHQNQQAIRNCKAALAIVAGNDIRSQFSQWIAGKAYKRLGQNFTELGPLPAALDAFRHAAEIRRRLVREYPTNLEYQRELFAVDLNLGEILGGAEYPSIGDIATTSLYFTEARKIAEKLARMDSRNMQARADLGSAYARTAEAESFSHPAAAVNWYFKSIAIAREIQAGTYCKRHSQLDLAIRSRELAETLARTGRTREAISQAQTSHDVLTLLAASQPARNEFRRQLMSTDCVLCDLQWESGNGEAARASQRSATELLNSLSESEPGLSLEHSIAKCYRTFSRTDPENSQAWREKGQQLWTALKRDGVGSSLQVGPGMKAATGPVNLY